MMEPLRKRVLRDRNVLDHKTGEVSRRYSAAIKKTPDTNNNAKKRKLCDKSSTKSQSIKNSSPKKSPIKKQTKLSIYFTSPGTSSSKVTGKESLSPTKEEDSKVVEYKINYLFNKDLTSPALSPFSPVGLCCLLPSVCESLSHKVTVQEIDEDKQCLTFLVTEGIWYILPFSCECLNKNVYLSSRLLRSIFYGITVEKNDNVSYRLVEAFKRHLRMHPPCRKDLKHLYHSLLFDNIQVEEYTSQKIVQYDFKNIINSIEETLKLIPDDCIDEDPQPTKDEEIDKAKILEKIKNASAEDLMFYFYKTYIEKDNVLSLPKYKQKKDDEEAIKPITLLQRLFHVFSLVLDILEADFKMWRMESTYNLREEINSSYASPFIIHAGWTKNEEKGCINDHCKQIFRIFRRCPQKYRPHLSRYITLCFQVAQGNEVNEGFVFPYYHRLCNSFAKELASHILDEYEFSEKMVSLVQYIHPPWLKYKVCALILDPDTNLDQGDLNTAYRIILRSVENQNISSIRSAQNIKPSISTLASKCIENNSSGETELHKLCKNNNKNDTILLTKYLKNTGTNVNVQDNSGWSPLHHAAYNNSEECIKLLLEYRPPSIGKAEGLDIHILNDDHDSPLMCAVRQGNIEAVDILLKNGAGPTVRNKNLNGEAPIDLASREIKRKLLSSWKNNLITKMSPVEVDLLFVMICGYCSAFHIKEVPDPGYHLCSTKPDDLFRYNYKQYLKDDVTFGNLLIIVNKLSEVPSNPKNLKYLLQFLKSCC